VRAIGLDPVHGTRACFRALVEATSRPGTVAASPVEPADHAVLATLADHEVSLHSPDDRIRTALEAEGRLAEADAESAAVVHAPDPDACPVRDLARGSLEEPSEGATVVFRVDALRADPEGSADATLTLSGPGVPSRRTIGVEGLAPGTARALADAQATYPRGVDAVLTADRSIAAVPRSTELEVR
jgi:alpha-D-ribose 1-methylphosphonate 5-triphosphate synthase subunit PhnH